MDYFEDCLKKETILVEELIRNKKVKEKTGSK